jgi:hypothetical protein
MDLARFGRRRVLCRPLGGDKGKQAFTFRCSVSRASFLSGRAQRRTKSRARKALNSAMVNAEHLAFLLRTVIGNFGQGVIPPAGPVPVRNTLPAMASLSATMCSRRIRSFSTAVEGVRWETEFTVCRELCGARESSDARDPFRHSSHQLPSGVPFAACEAAFPLRHRTSTCSDSLAQDQ